MKGIKSLLTILLITVCSALCAQNITVRGTVTDASNGDPVPAASVIVSGTTNGVVSDVNGNYSITAPSDGVLIFSSIGYETMQVPVRGNRTLSVEMTPSTEFLDETIVVAYGTAKKSSYSGSATMVRAEELAQKPVSSVEQALQGKVAGLQVSTASGQPGATTSFRIRGTGTLNASAEPLYVIDGVATTNASYSQNASSANTTSSILSTINPQDIESITVLKDAAAASLYGSRAANGVVIITTKSGKAGTGHVNFNAQVGVATVAKTYQMMSSADYYKKAFMSYMEGGDDAATANLKAQGLTSWNPYNISNPLDASGNVASGAKIIIDTDWQKEVFTPGITQDYSLSFSGGTDKLNYFVSGGYFDQKGTSPTSRYTRYSGKASVDAQVNKWFKGGANVIFSYATQNSEVSQSAGASPLYNALTFPNAVPVYKVDANGNYELDANGDRQFNWSNPVARDFNPIAIPSMNINTANTARLFASLYAEVKLAEGLTAKTVFSPDYVSVYDTSYWNKYHGDGPAYAGRGTKAQTSDLMFTSTTTLNFNHTFADRHNFSAMAGYEFWKSRRNYFNGAATNFAFDFMTELAGAGNIQSLTSYYNDAALISYLGHAEYNFDEKYFLSASFRRDGSSVFGADNKWGNFFSVGASWRIKQEAFMQDADLVSDLKLRASYGTSGNNAGLGRYQSLGLWVAANNYQYGNNAGLGHESLSNSELGWEKQKMLNVGLDFGFFKNRITGSVEYFNKASDDLLYDFPLPASHGVAGYYDQVSSVMMNLAKVRNHGVEFVLNAIPVQSKDFTWDVSFNFSYNEDEILDLAGDDDITMSDTKKIWKVGESQYEFYLPTWMGVDPANGDPLWKKDNGTTNNYSEADYDLQGRATPWGFGALTNNLSWKGLNFSFMFYYNLGGKVYDSLYATIMHDGNDPGKNLHVDALNAWTPSNTNTDVPKYSNANDNQSNSPSTRFLYDATYLKLKNVNLSYSLPKNLLKKTAISNMRFYVNVDNIYTIFKDKGYKGYDDLDIFGIGGYDAYANYIPLSRSYTLGVNLTF
jgi:TonB-linked SusC/RagA family outer membrane protein